MIFNYLIWDKMCRNFYEGRKGASTLRFCAFSVDEDKVRGYLRDLEGICQTKVAMNLSRLLKTIDARGTLQGITKKQEK